MRCTVSTKGYPAKPVCAAIEKCCGGADGRGDGGYGVGRVVVAYASGTARVLVGCEKRVVAAAGIERGQVRQRADAVVFDGRQLRDWRGVWLVGVAASRRPSAGRRGFVVQVASRVVCLQRLLAAAVLLTLEDESGLIHRPSERPSRSVSRARCGALWWYTKSESPGATIR